MGQVGHVCCKATLAHTIKVLWRLMIRIHQSIRRINLARIGEHGAIEDPNLVRYKIYRMINQGNSF